MLEEVSAIFLLKLGPVQLLTEAEHDVKEHNQQDRNSIDGIAGRAHPKWPFGNILSTGEEMWPDG